MSARAASRHPGWEETRTVWNPDGRHARGATILMTHVPVAAESAARSGVGLMLAGHTHGGQLWPFGLLESGIYPLLAGRYEVRGMPVIVSRGTGTWGPRMRLWRPGEIVRVTLRFAPPRRPVWEVYALRYATLPGFTASDLVAGADPGRRLNIAMAVWLLKGPGGRTVLVDTGFHREELFRQWRVEGFTSPAEVLAKVGVRAADVSDVILTHLHWDHAGGLDLFPDAHVWVQAAEWAAASEAATRPGGVAAADVAVLRSRERTGRLTIVDGDGREVIPGITLYVGGRHTPGSEYVGVTTRAGTVVVASDAVYLYENLEKGLPIAQTLDAAANLEAQRRMRGIASSPRLIVPGHDPEVFLRFPAPGHGVARID